jgi:hypothetical protein
LSGWIIVLLVDHLRLAKIRIERLAIVDATSIPAAKLGTWK